MAREHLGLVLRDDPRNVPALQLLARAYAGQGDLAPARRTAERALDLDPNGLPALELVAALALRTGDKPRALALAKRIHQVMPEAESPIARHIVAQLTGGQPPKH